MHGAARLAGDRLGHEGGVHVVAQRRFAHRALEKEHLIGQAQRLRMKKIDFHLACANFVNQRIHIEFHLVAEVVNFFKQRVELVDGIDAVGLARGLAAAAAANGGAQQSIGVGVAGGQVKLQLGGHDRLQSLSRKQITHPAQNGARGKRHQIALVVKAVVDHLRGGVGGPRHDAHGRRIRAQLHVLVGGVDHVVVGTAFGEFARDTHRHHRLRQAHAAIFGELDARQDLAPCHAGQVGHQAFHFGHAALVEPLLQIVEIH